VERVYKVALDRVTQTVQCKLLGDIGENIEDSNVHSDTEIKEGKKKYGQTVERLKKATVDIEVQNRQKLQGEVLTDSRQTEEDSIVHSVPELTDDIVRY
jgi:hypothetical protein